MKVNICDFCDRQIKTDYSIKLKENTGIFGKKIRYDFCTQCWMNMHRWVKTVSRKEGILNENTGK